MYYACLMVKAGDADGVVSGACHSTANTLRPSLQIIKTKPGIKLVSAFFLMVVPNCEYGADGVFVFADSGLEQNPDPEKLAAIAQCSAESFELLTEKPAYVAMLSHSTKGSAKHADVDKVVEATRIVKENAPELNVDGELQLDAAIVPSVGESKLTCWYSLTLMLAILVTNSFRDWLKLKHTALLLRVLPCRLMTFQEVAQQKILLALLQLLVFRHRQNNF